MIDGTPSVAAMILAEALGSAVFLVPLGAWNASAVPAASRPQKKTTTIAPATFLIIMLRRTSIAVPLIVDPIAIAFVPFLPAKLKAAWRL